MTDHCRVDGTAVRPRIQWLWRRAIPAGIPMTICRDNVSQRVGGVGFSWATTALRFVWISEQCAISDGFAKGRRCHEYLWRWR